MGCTFEIVIPGHAWREAEQAARAAFTEVERLESCLSRFRPESDVSAINALCAGRSARVGIETIECLRLALEVYRESGGVFDVAFASAASGGPVQPRPTVADLNIDPRERLVTPLRDGVRLDFGALGKGYALDQMRPILQDWGITAALLHCGQSTVLPLGRPPGGEDWVVALRDPRDQDRALRRLRLGGRALSGSGRAIHGEHIVDARSGRPPESTRAAWALAPSAAQADALSTAFMLMPSEGVEAYCREHPEAWGAVMRCTPGDARLLSFGRLS
jgi:thiamine biosynthesis lipoprotein